MSDATRAAPPAAAEMLPSHDIETLRALARKVAELASRDIEREKRELWYAHNALHSVRPLIFCDPENGWHEIIRQEDFLCQSPLGRTWEWFLRREIAWGELIRDDRVITGVFDVGYAVTETGWGMEERRIGGQDGGAYTWDPPVKDLSDLSGLHYPQVSVDFAATERMLECAREVFDGILQVRLHHYWVWSVGLTWTLVRLRGLEQMMVDMVEDPDGLHRLMAFLRDGTIARLEYLEREGLLCLNNRGEYVGSGGFGWTRELPRPDFTGTVRLKDLWGMAESQETVCVSPAMFEEFVFPYQLPILERFGLTCYGCCEPVHSRWHIIRRIPNLRRVSVSPWCDVEAMAENLQDRYILSLKPNPSYLGGRVFEEEAARRELREKLARARGCRVEIIMKDCHTIGQDPQRVRRWVEIAREESERAWA